jgi:hypothetical protein
MRAANHASERTKAAKVLVFEKPGDVWATVEFLAEGTAQFEAMFERMLGVLRFAVQRFGEEMRASEPIADTRIALTRAEITRYQAEN